MVGLPGVLVGIIATLTMDILTVGASKLRLIAPLAPNLMGRWFGYVVRRQPLQTDIARAAPIRREMAIALPVHYAIGTTLALVYLFVSISLGLNPRSPITALVFSLCTNILPWLLMFPAMGYGFFGAKGPPGTRLFLSSFVSHAFYGVGLWLGASVVR